MIDSTEDKRACWWVETAEGGVRPVLTAEKKARGLTYPTANERRVGHTMLIVRPPWKLALCEFSVSTVFLAIDHAYPEDDGPVLYETMVFTEYEPLDNAMWRYKTRESAERGHRHIARLIARRRFKALDRLLPMVEPDCGQPGAVMDFPWQTPLRLVDWIQPGTP